MSGQKDSRDPESHCWAIAEQRRVVSKCTPSRRCPGLARTQVWAHNGHGGKGGARGERTRSRRPGGVIRRLTCPKGVRANRSQPRVGAEPGQEPRGLESGRTPSLGYVLSSPVCTPQGGARPWYRVCPGGPTSSGPHPSPPLHSSFHTEPGFSVEGLAPPPTPGRALTGWVSQHIL